MNHYKRPELLAPAGGMSQLKAAIRFGADAVYGGLSRFGLRASADLFTMESLGEALEIVHGAGKKFYLTLNILPYDDELEDLAETAREAWEHGIDAALVSDPGAFLIIKKRVPQLSLHVSTQANVMNAETARLFMDLGASRIVLSRELSLKRIAELKKQLPDSTELEAFVHGAMCMAYSGRCMLSDHLAGRGGNRGDCAQPCRWQYHLVEEKRPGEIISVEEDGRGTSIFSSYDLCMLEHLPDMLASGISSLKIEGRMKTAFYVSHVVTCYRQALDLLIYEGEEAYRAALPRLMKELEKASHRPWNTGFYYGAPQPSGGAGGVTQTMEYTADVISWENELLTLRVKNRFYVGDTLEILRPDGFASLLIERITDFETGKELQTVSVAGQIVQVPCHCQVAPGDYVRGPNRNHQSSFGCQSKGSEL